MKSITIQWQTINEKIGQQSLRERLMILASMLAILYFIASIVVFPLLDKAHKERQQILTAKQEQMLAYQQETIKIKNRSQQQTDENNRQHLANLKKQIGSANAELIDFTTSLVAPTKMAALIEVIVADQHNLQLLQLKNLPPRPLTDPASEQAATEASNESENQPAATLIYKHGLLIELKGHYHDIINFLTTLEKTPYRMLWQEMNLHSEESPLSSVTLLLYTLSLKSTWLEV